ncbi:MAG: polysaccharide biosynthesis protein [Oscillospiraceae bacterium]|jgi:stage V sporulation protein B|nr:polysaccharide biosynthesis protein [Oscillospiraceae bacterium]
MKRTNLNVQQDPSNAGQSMLNGAMILTISMVIVKVIGLLYKWPLVNIYGIVGKGIFSSAFILYSTVYAIAIAGLPIAVARMVSERVATGRLRDAEEIRKVASRLFYVTGFIGMIAMFALAYPYAKYLCTGQLQALPAILAVAPSIFFCCGMSIYRGYYEGLRNMIPTAVSQVIEALCKLILGIALALLCMRLGQMEFLRHGTVFGNPVADMYAANAALYPWAAAASIIGITVGTVLGFVYLWLRHMIKGDGFTREQMVNAPPAKPRVELRREMIKLAIPMVLSAVILNITNFIDSTNVQALLENMVVKHADIIDGIYQNVFSLNKTPFDQKASAIFGIYTTVLDFRNLIPTIVTALGISALPSISAAWALRQKQTVQKTINSVLRVSLMISLPAGFGLTVLSDEIPRLFFESDNPGLTEHAAPLMVMFGLSTALMSISSPITNMLQGIGRTDIPVISLVVGAVVKIVSNFILVGNPSINIQGAPIGSILCYVAIVSINLAMLLRISKAKVKLLSVLWKPLFCAVLSGAAAWIAKTTVQRFDLVAKILPSFSAEHGEKITLVAAIGCAIVAATIIYLISMLLCRVITADDLEMLPKAKKLKKVLAKFDLLG